MMDGRKRKKKITKRIIRWPVQKRRKKGVIEPQVSTESAIRLEIKQFAGMTMLNRIISIVCVQSSLPNLDTIPNHDDEL